MFCPECKYEYADSIKICPVCGNLLVETISKKDNQETEPKHVEFITIMETGDRALIAFIKSILEDAGINYFINGETLLNLGRSALDVKIQVDKNDVETAKELLKEII